MTNPLIHKFKSAHIERTADNQGYDIHIAYTWGAGWTCFMIHWPEIPKEQAFYDRLHHHSHATRAKTAEDVIKYFPNLFTNMPYERYTY